MTDSILKHIDRIIRQRPASGPALSSFRDLAVLMEGPLPEIRPIPENTPVEDMKREEGFPLFARGDLPVDMDGATRLLEKFLEHLKDKNRKDREGIGKALGRCKADPQWARALFTAVLNGKTSRLSAIAGGVDLDPGVLRFLGHLALRPSFQAIRKAVSGRLDREHWGEAYCPLCGSRPGMAFFAKTGKRHLHCGLCGEEWAFDRLRCPFCGNDTQEDLGYFQAEQEEGFRVDFCRKCNRYIKTVDRRVLEEAAPMDLENLATLHLDILATREGFIQDSF